MNDFIFGVLSSIVGSVILILATSLISRKARWIFTGLISRLLDIDIDYVFKNKEDVHDDLVAELTKSRTIAILTSRGNEFQRHTFENLFAPSGSGNHKRVRVLLPATDLRSGEYDWIKQREDEMTKIDPAFGKGLMHEQIEHNVKLLQQHLAANHVEVRQFNFPHQGRLVITERYVYFTPYHSEAQGRDSKVYKFGRGGEMYDNWLRLFEQYWRAAHNDNNIS